MVAQVKIAQIIGLGMLVFFGLLMLPVVAARAGMDFPLLTPQLLEQAGFDPGSEETFEGLSIFVGVSAFIYATASGLIWIMKRLGMDFSTKRT